MANYSDIRYEVTGTDVYTAISDLPLSGVDTGTQAFVSGTNRLYMWTGTGWYNIALINTNPSLSGAASSYSLSNEGANTVVTLSSTDPEGIPISFSVSHSGIGVGANAIATVTQSNNIFTFTPTTNTALAGTFTTTFTASDGVNVAVANSSFTLAFIVNIENSNYTTALITSVGTNNQVNDTFVDSSTNSHTITAAGNATQTTFSPYREGGYSTYFDGTGDYIRYDDASLAEGTDDFTVECWVYRIGSQSQNDTVVGHDTTPGYQIAFGSTNNLRFDKTASGGDELLDTGTLDENRWYHVVYQRSSGTLQGFLDGVSLGTASVTTNFTNERIEVGVNRGGTAYFNGYLRDVRIIKGTAYYNSAGFSVPTETLTAVSGTGYSTTLLTCHLPYIADGGANSLTPIINGDTKTEPFSPYDYETYSATDNGGSMYLDGTGDYLSIADHADLDMGSSNFTIEGWYYPVVTPSSANGLLSKRANSSEANGVLIYFAAATTPAPSLLVAQSGSWSINSASSIEFKTGQWNHFAAVRNGTSFKLYINGKAGVSVTSSITVTDNGHAFVIGAMGADGSNVLAESNIADFRVVKGTAVYTADFTPPTAPLTAITNASLLLSGTNAGIIDKSQTVKSLTLNGDVKSSTTQTKYLSSSMYFDGTGDRIEVANSTELQMGTGDFTFEWWWYPTTAAIMRPICINGTGAGSWSIVMYANQTFDLVFATSPVFSSVISYSINTWEHIAIVRENGTVTCYIDGISQQSATNTTNLNATTVLGIGYDTAASSQAYQGYISDVRITKGLARYTSNFTPPTAALQG